ncbi:hypothetical protein KIN20_013820 [Parelaphostrongylus tenuis]|uniref:Uncharacterized protein n=1 Tax=Parelaphostrongylus tenuis TaxID=148309 RepID=A0AAD5QP05_PARTN|nr:hypothetical protein KIN20_013820 [Parelaphostrongylus tenuis]
MLDAALSVSEQRDSLDISDDGGESPDESGKRKQRSSRNFKERIERHSVPINSTN